jgi:hypothetical protein
MPALRARLAVVVAALGIGAAAWLAGDGGGARAAIGQATGPLVATAPGDAAVLVAQNLAPGQERAGEVTVTNAGDASGGFALSTSGLTDSGAPLSGVLELAVDDLTAARGVYSGPLSGLGSVELGTLAQGEAHRYRFTVRFPGGRPDSVDNAYQGASTALTFVWSATAASTPGSGPAGPGAATAGTPAAPVVAAGTGKVPRIAIGAALRQNGARGRITTWVSCEQTCRIALSGTAAFAKRTQRLRTVRGSLHAAGRIRMRMTLPRAARATVAAGRSVTVRLRAKATMGPRVAVTRRTILVARPR